MVTVRLPAMKIFQDTSPGPQPRGGAARPATASAAIAGRKVGGVLGNISTNAQPIFRQSLSGNIGSPAKKKLDSISAQGRGSVFQQSFENIAMPPPRRAPLTADSPIKKPPFSVFNTSLPNGPAIRKPQSSYMPNFGRAKAAFAASAADKENAFPPIPTIPNVQRERSLLDIEKDLTNALAPKPVNQQKIAPRKLQDPAPLKEKPVVKKAAPSSPSQIVIPEPHEMPSISDDGKKPAYSYATLIGMAILRAPGRRLTLAQIYKWISDTFAYYRQSDHGWQNSIRHNLSLNKALVRQERPKDEPGKGSYWTIKPGQEYQFLGTKGGQKRGVPSSKKAVAPKKPTTSSPAPTQDTLPSLPPIPTTDATEVPDDATQINISSDATLTATPSPRVSMDNAGHHIDVVPYVNFAIPSSPPRHLQSSPPMRAPPPRMLGETPPPLPQLSRKRKHSNANLNDSGYISSLESSVMRVTDEERRIKRGRAEEDIARIRRSSMAESPIPRMQKTAQPRSSAFLTSSPLPPAFEPTQLAPLTPATTLHPRKVPQSVSPNTNLKDLRNKIRELVGSPSRDVDVLNNGNDWDSTFDTFINTDSPYAAPNANGDLQLASPMPYIRGITCDGSPFKKPAGRNQLHFNESSFLSVPEVSFFFNDETFLNGDEDDFASAFLDVPSA